MISSKDIYITNLTIGELSQTAESDTVLNNKGLVIAVAKA
jgi:hypothetical protein